MISQIEWADVLNYFTNAKKSIVLIMPAIHEEWIQAIENNKDKIHLKIKVCIDNSEEVIRSGYGSIESLEKLKELNAEIKECDEPRINFLSIDGVGFCLFLESRILVGEPHGYNAIHIDMASSNKIINQFFPDTVSSLFPIPNASKILAIPLDEVKAEIVKKSIKKNPPSEPDLTRQINTYTALFQYAEIHFEGADIQSTTITIPSSALPFKNSDLKNRMKTRFNLFSKDQTEKWQNFQALKVEVEKVRTEYLVPCNLKRERSILRKDRKDEFEKQIERLKKLAEANTKKLITQVQEAINSSEDVLSNELKEFLVANLPDELKEFTDVKVQDRQLQKMVEKIIHKTKLPSAHSLLGKIKIEEQFSDMTIEDLDNKEFLEWFKMKKLITEEEDSRLANFRVAYEVKENTFT